MQTSAADPKQVTDAKKRERRLSSERVEDVRWVLSTVQGRRFFWRVLELCGVYSSDESMSTNSEFFQKGKRIIGLTLLRELNEARPEAYLEMVSESRRKEAAENA